MNPYLRSNLRLTLDYVIGFRAWGLILYGALPSSLAALDILRVPEVDTQSGGQVLATVLMMLIPLVVLWLLVRQRLSSWYLMSDFAFTRILSVTLGISAISIAISVSAGLSDGTYAFPWSDEWSLAKSSEQWSWLLDASLSSTMALIVTSALFITAIKEGGGLPGLPSAQAVAKLVELKNSLTAVQASSNSSTPIKDRFYSELENADQAAKWLYDHSKGLPGQRALFELLREDLTGVKEALEQVDRDRNKWDDIFSTEFENSRNHAEKAFRDNVVRLKRLRLNA